MSASLILALSVLAVSLIVAMVVGYVHEAKRRILFASAKPWATAAQGEMARLEGKVSPGVRGSFATPITEKQVVWLELIGSEEKSSDSFDEFLRDVSSRPFVIEGVEDSPTIALDKELPRPLPTSSSGPVVDLSPRLRAFLEERRKPIPSSADGFTRRREYRERYLEVGAPIFVIVAKTAGAGGASGYRDPAAADDSSVTPELVHTSEAALLDELGVRERLGEGAGAGLLVCFILGIAAAIVRGVVAMFLE